MLIDTRSDIQLLESNILPPELNLETFYLTYLTLELAKMTFIMRILDVYVLIVKNLNPFSLSRKVTDKTKHEMVYMIWRECIRSEFYRYICEEKNFIYLNGRDVGQTGVLEIVGGFTDQGKQNLRMLQEHLA